jgi:predicted transcriptional regulator
MGGIRRDGMEEGWPMSAVTTCTNPMCSCTNCTCSSCSCGAAKLGDLERRVMDILWKSADRESTGRQVADELPEYAYTTVATLLDRLSQKGLVHRRMEGRTIRFAAVGSEGAHTAVLMRETLAAGHDPEASLTRFAETLSDSEAAALRHALDRLDRKQPG